MANDLNQCNFIGRLGRDPESRFMPSGEAVVNFSIAVGWKGKDTEGAEWVRVTAYGKLAEICGQYLKKGSQVFVSCRARTRKWTDQAGVERYTTEFIADQMQMLGGRQDSGGDDDQTTRQQTRAPAPAPRPAPAPAPSSAAADPFDDSEIPF
jgi:single-strand DNA-binding protein